MEGVEQKEELVNDEAKSEEDMGIYNYNVYNVK